MTTPDDDVVTRMHTWAILRHGAGGTMEQNPVGVSRDRADAMKAAGRALLDAGEDAAFATVNAIPVNALSEYGAPVAVWVGVVDPVVGALVWQQFGS